MKKIIYFLLAAAAVTVASCQDDPETLYNVPVQLLQYGDTLKLSAPVSFESSVSKHSVTTDELGFAVAKLPVGSYTASVSFKTGNTIYGGTVKDIVIDQAFADTVKIAVSSSQTSALVIKEIYFPGCMDNAGSKAYANDKYMIVYNNSDKEVDASRMCVAMAQSTCVASSNKYPFGADGIIEYERAGWTPASDAVWWFNTGTVVKIPAYGQIVIAVTGAVDHTKTYSNSVDLSEADYCFYDRESGFNLDSNYPAPAFSDTTRYMKTIRYGQSTAWSIGLTGFHAPYIFTPDDGVDIKAFVKNESNFDNRSTNKSGNYAKIPTTWIMDGVETWNVDDSNKYYHRLPTTVNTGHAIWETKKGYTIYRNVDKTATEAIEGNAAKLVYNYSGAVSAEDTDPSGIDAEASIANGAKIVYMDTNNSKDDFHMRKVASIKK